MVDIKEIKAQIRSVLLSLGKTATEQEFRKAYYEIEGATFNEVLRQLNISFHDLFLRIPDVAKIVYAYNQVFIQRVSSEATAHMENLTVNKYSKNYRGPKLVTKSGAIKGRPMTYPLSAKAPVYAPYPRYTVPQKKVPLQQNRQYGYQKPAQNNFNMKVSFGTNNNRNIQCYYSNNASTSYSKPAVSSGMTTSSNQASNFANISNTSTRNDLSTEVKTKDYEIPKVFHNAANLSKVSSMPQTSITASNLETLTKTSRMPPPPSDISSISSIADSESTRVADDFNDDFNDKNSVKSEYESALDTTLKKTPQKILTESPRIAPMASTSKQTLKHSITSLLRSNKKEEVKDSRLETLADKVLDKMENLKLDDKRKSMDSNGKQFPNPFMVRQRLRSMRIFREALLATNLTQEKSSQYTELLFSTKDIIELPEPIQNEEEQFFIMKIIDVASPSKFVFQFSFQRLKDLSNKMNDFYNNLQNIAKYQAKDLVNDNIVAIRRNDFWYRGQIKSFSETDAYIQFVDSMKIREEKVSRKNIFHLHQKFTTESPKSAFGKLHGLKANNGEWNMRSTAKLDSIHDKILLANVKSIENGVYSLSIILEAQNFTRVCDIFIEEDLAALELEDFATEAVFRSLV